MKLKLSLVLLLTINIKYSYAHTVADNKYSDVIAAWINDKSYVNYDWDDPNNRVKPNNEVSHELENGFVITQMRLQQIRSNLLYWFHDQGGEDDWGEYLLSIRTSAPQVHANFNFNLPFFGFRFNYTRVSTHGFLEFSDPPDRFTYPLEFPTKKWPHRNDPSFIGIFFSKCRIGRIRPTDVDQRRPGLYYRIEHDLRTRTDRVGVEMRERTKWDIREGIIGADNFDPKHVIVVTWKNMSFAGGIPNASFNTNTFQMVIATDEVRTYAIFNYVDINWTTHTEAGGDTYIGVGGVPAFVGFNAGNGTQSFEYKPYSQSSAIRNITSQGWGNGLPGRHIFRLDEVILPGSCNEDFHGSLNHPLGIAPESGNMLGGTIVNITGPCFLPTDNILCRFDTEVVMGYFIDNNRAICVQPRLYTEGYIRLEVAIGTGPFSWCGRYFVETPLTATERIYFETNDVYLESPPTIKILWDQSNLTTNFNADVTISLYGYSKDNIGPQLEYIDVIETEIPNTGKYIISPSNYENRDNSQHAHMQFGFIKINLTNPVHYTGFGVSPTLWSKPIPLAWYFSPQWKKSHGVNWPETFCEDLFMNNFEAELPHCPCTIGHVLLDKGRFLPDLECDKDSNPTCLHHKGAIHCVKSGTLSETGSGQQCCYDRNDFLMLSHDQVWGSRPRRSHNTGQAPWNQATNVPSLSTWFNDISPFYSYCMWQDERDNNCEQFRTKFRSTHDCVGYQSPGVASVFGDLHIITFDNFKYTFRGIGEFVLFRCNNSDELIDIQGRFKQVPTNVYGSVITTQMTSIAARGSTTPIIEVRLRPQHAQWRYKLDVFADGQRIFFDRQSLKFQHFSGVTVYTPTYILNQSKVIIMFSSSVGVEVAENGGSLMARVYAPRSFINKTRGLFGNWSLDIGDDFTLPDDTIFVPNVNNFEILNRDFVVHWMLSDPEIAGVGSSLFLREFGRSSNDFTNNFIRDDVIMASELSDECHQYRSDFGMTLNQDSAYVTLNQCRRFLNLPKTLQKYKTFIRPCIEHCCQFRRIASTTTLLVLDRVQRRAKRIIRNPRLTKYLDRLQHREFIYRTSKKWNSLKNLELPQNYKIKILKATINVYLMDRILGVEAMPVTKSYNRL